MPQSSSSLAALAKVLKAADGPRRMDSSHMGRGSIGSAEVHGWVLRSGGLKVRLAQVDCVGEFKGKGSGRVFGNDQR